MGFILKKNFAFLTNRRNILVSLSLVGILAAGYALAQRLAPPAGDPFATIAAANWHAIGQTWPGTMRFDGAKKTIELAPMGAPKIEGTYTFKIKHASSNMVEFAKLVEGDLRMVNKHGQVSSSQFKIETTERGRTLHLTYNSGQRPEDYILLSEENAQQERARLQRMLQSGELLPLQRAITGGLPK